MASPQCVSISSVVSHWLEQRPLETEVLACFASVINLRVHCADGSQVVSLCSPTIGNGPLNVLVDAWPDWCALTVNSSVVIRGHSIELGGEVIDCGAAPRWHPSPDWGVIRSTWDSDAPARLRAAATVHASRSPLLALTCGLSIPPPLFIPGLSQLDVWRRSQQPADLAVAAKTLAGLGAGLTPAGDDFLCGLLLGIWATQPSPVSLCSIVADSAVSLTTTLSAAFLRSAARGEVSASWLDLLEGLYRSLPPAQLEMLVRKVAAAGYSSGADMLAGFLWLGAVFAKDCSGTGQGT